SFPPTLSAAPGPAAGRRGGRGSGASGPRLEPPGQAVMVGRRQKSPSAGAWVMATRLRHIAIIVPDPETAAQFFEQAFDMKRVGNGRRGIYMSDGVMNVALLKKESDDEPIGLYHFGMWVDDLADA